jgi:acyl transferase domain-containing protein
MSDQNGREIAIIGLACRFPEADDPAQFWANLREGRNSIRQVPPDRWAAAGWAVTTPIST